MLEIIELVPFGTNTGRNTLLIRATLMYLLGGLCGLGRSRCQALYTSGLAVARVSCWVSQPLARSRRIG